MRPKRKVQKTKAKSTRRDCLAFDNRFIQEEDVCPMTFIDTYTLQNIIRRDYNG